MLAAAGCTGGSGADGAIVRDSSGVLIVESSSPAWREGDEWRINPEPLISIGMVEGPVEYQLLRVANAFRSRDGQILVANAGTNEIRVYGNDGAFLHSMGRTGGGPGEFARLRSVYLHRDSVFAYDWGQQRISVFDPRGTFVRSFGVADAPGTGLVTALGRFGNGQWVLERSTFGLTPGLVRATSTYSRFAEGDSAAAAIGTFAGRESIVQPVGSDGIGAYVRSAPYSRQPTTLVSGNELVYAGAERYEIAVHDAGGALRKLVRRTVDPEPISGKDLALWETEVEATRPPYSPSLPPMFHRPISEFELPETKAAYGPVVIDELGNYWVAEYTFGTQRTTWSVFDAGGVLLGEVASPERFRILEIGPDYVLGVYRDDLDVEYVRLHPLTK